MKKMVFLATLFIIKSGTDAYAQQPRQLTLVNNNTCAATITFAVSAIDAGSSGCPAKTFTTTLANSTVVSGEDLLSFDVPSGAGPNSWDLSGTIVSSPSWGAAQVTWPGEGTVPVGSTTGSYTCASVSNTNSITRPGCTVNITWIEDAFGNVKIKVN